MPEGGVAPSLPVPFKSKDVGVGKAFCERLARAIIQGFEDEMAMRLRGGGQSGSMRKRKKRQRPHKYGAVHEEGRHRGRAHEPRREPLTAAW